MSNFISEGMFCLHVTKVRISLLWIVGKNCLDICIILCVDLTIGSQEIIWSFNLERLFQSKIRVENAWQCYLLRVTFCLTREGTSDKWGNKDICRLGASGSGVDLSQNFDGVFDSVHQLEIISVANILCIYEAYKDVIISWASNQLTWN